MTEGRLVGGVSAALNAIELDGHGLALDDACSFRAEAGGSLPSPLAEGATYYAIPLDDNRFSVAAAAGGAAIDLTTAGARAVVIVPAPVAKAIAWASRLIDDMLPAHVVPLAEPYPEIIRMTCAELAAAKLLALAGSESRTISEIADAARKRLDRWGKGVPIRGDNAPAAAGLAAGAAVGTATDTRGWRRFGGIA